jgi:hypothetical protein
VGLTLFFMLRPYEAECYEFVPNDDIANILILSATRLVSNYLMMFLTLYIFWWGRVGPIKEVEVNMMETSSIFSCNYRRMDSPVSNSVAGAEESKSGSELVYSEYY